MSKPTISLNKLSEYIRATAIRRKTIIDDAKNPKAYKASWYGNTVNPIFDFFSSGFNPLILQKAIEILDNTKPTGEHQKKDKRVSIGLLDALSEMELPSLAGCTFSKPDLPCPKLEIEGVEVKVTPDLIVRGENDKGIFVGAIKIHKTKTVAFHLGEEGTKDVATMLRDYTSKHIAEDGEIVDDNLCLSIDVFANAFNSAPRSFKRRMKNISAACEEIAGSWHRF